MMVEAGSTYQRFNYSNNAWHLSQKNVIIFCGVSYPNLPDDIIINNSNIY